MSFIINEDTNVNEDSALLGALPSDALYGIGFAQSSAYPPYKLRASDLTLPNSSDRKNHSSFYYRDIVTRTKALRAAVAAAGILQIASIITGILGVTRTRMGQTSSAWWFLPIFSIDFAITFGVLLLSLFASFKKNTQLLSLASYLFCSIIYLFCAQLLFLVIYVVLLSYRHGNWLTANKEQELTFSREQISEFNNYLIVIIVIKVLSSFLSYYLSRATMELVVSISVEKKKSSLMAADPTASESYGTFSETIAS